MRIEFDLRKSVQGNISHYFEQSKKAKAKRARLEQAIASVKERIAQLEEKKQAKTPIWHQKRSKEWFEKFHWFYTSDGLLCIAGRDAVSNEQLVKKHLQEGDLYFHADVQGAAHAVLKMQHNTAPENSKTECAQFAALWSKAWNEKLGNADVYSALPSQVSKKAPSGESLGRGAFMVYGQREWFRKIPLRCAAGVEQTPQGYRVISGPKSAIEKRAVWWIELVPGTLSKNALAKQLSALFSKQFPASSIPLDEWISMLPNGESDIASPKT